MTHDDVPPAAPKSKTLSLVDLLPAKLRLETSLGSLYVRYAGVSDWKHLKIDDAVERGRAAVRQLVNRSDDEKVNSPLADEDLDALNDSDFDLLAVAITKQNGWAELPTGPALQALGQVIEAEKEKERGRHQKMLDDLRRTIGGSYAFLGESTLDKLKDQVAGLADIRMGITGSEALQKSLGITRSYEDAIRSVGKPNVPAGIEARLTTEMSRIYRPPSFEETPAGRATIESARNSLEVAKKIDTLAVVVGGLNQTLITEVLPSWFRQVEVEQKSAKDSFDHAAKALKWTKWAVIASVVVTALATWWQVSVARGIDGANSIQQKNTESILREQLAAQQKLIVLQAQDSEKLRELLRSKPDTPARKK